MSELQQTQDWSKAPRKLDDTEAQEVVDAFVAINTHLRGRIKGIDVWGHANHSGITLMDENNQGIVQISTDSPNIVETAKSNPESISVFWRQDFEEEDQQ